MTTADHTPLRRLEHWRDVGTTTNYCAGNAEFAADVIAVLARVRELEDGLRKARVAIATWSPDPTEPLEEIDALLKDRSE